MKNIPQYLRSTYMLGGLLAAIGTMVFFTGSKESREESAPADFRSSYQIYPVPIPAQADFAGEKVALQDIDVKERLERELIVNAYWQSQTLLLLKRAGRWFPVIEPILKKNGIPDDFKYLAAAESGLVNAVSPAGATGFWQILQTTANEYGLETDDDVDQRYDVEKSTEAACQYLKKAHQRFGNWTMAAASYNMGMAGLENQTERQGQQAYYDLLLNDETARYMLRIVALKLIMSQPMQYGFQLRSSDLYTPYPTQKTTLDSSVQDLSAYAAGFGMNYKMLKILNPWMRDAHLKNDQNKTYTVTVPGPGFNKLFGK